MSIFTNYNEAEEFARIIINDCDDKYIMIMTDGIRWLVTTDYKAAKRLGFESHTSIYY